MTYLVEFAARAVRDLEILYREKNAAESHAAARWYNELELAVYALASYPQSQIPSPEPRTPNPESRAPSAMSRTPYPVPRIPDP
jgi:hypothetical protein